LICLPQLGQFFIPIAGPGAAAGVAATGWGEGTGGAGGLTAAIAGGAARAEGAAACRGAAGRATAAGGAPPDDGRRGIGAVAVLVSTGAACVITGAVMPARVPCACWRRHWLNDT
jgi:hypothetical protein